MLSTYVKDWLAIFEKGSISGRGSRIWTPPVAARVDGKLEKICLPTRLSPGAIYAIYPPINWSNSIRDSNISLLVPISFQNRFDPEPADGSLYLSLSLPYSGRKPIAAREQKEEKES